MLRGASLQNLTEWRQDSPFFGSVPQGVNVSGMLIPSNRVENIDILEFEPSRIFHGFLGDSASRKAHWDRRRQKNRAGK